MESVFDLNHQNKSQAKKDKIKEKTEKQDCFSNEDLYNNSDESNEKSFLNNCSKKNPNNTPTEIGLIKNNLNLKSKVAKPLNRNKRNDRKKNFPESLQLPNDSYTQMNENMVYNQKIQPISPVSKLEKERMIFNPKLEKQYSNTEMSNYRHNDFEPNSNQIQIKMENIEVNLLDECSYGKSTPRNSEDEIKSDKNLKENENEIASLNKQNLELELNINLEEFDKQFTNDVSNNQKSEILNMDDEFMISDEEELLNQLEQVFNIDQYQTETTNNETAKNLKPMSLVENKISNDFKNQAVNISKNKLSENQIYNENEVKKPLLNNNLEFYQNNNDIFYAKTKPNQIISSSISHENQISTLSIKNNNEDELQRQKRIEAITKHLKSDLIESFKPFDNFSNQSNINSKFQAKSNHSMLMDTDFDNNVPNLTINPSQCSSNSFSILKSFSQNEKSEFSFSHQQPHCEKINSSYQSINMKYRNQSNEFTTDQFTANISYNKNNTLNNDANTNALRKKLQERLQQRKAAALVTNPHGPINISPNSSICKPAQPNIAVVSPVVSTNPTSFNSNPNPHHIYPSSEGSNIFYNEQPEKSKPLFNQHSLDHQRNFPTENYQNPHMNKFNSHNKFNGYQANNSPISFQHFASAQETQTTTTTTTIVPQPQQTTTTTTVTVTTQHYPPVHPPMPLQVKQTLSTDTSNYYYSQNRNPNENKQNLMNNYNNIIKRPYTQPGSSSSKLDNEQYFYEKPIDPLTKSTLTPNSQKNMNCTLPNLEPLSQQTFPQDLNMQMPKNQLNKPHPYDKTLPNPENSLIMDEISNVSDYNNNNLKNRINNQNYGTYPPVMNMNRLDEPSLKDFNDMNVYSNSSQQLAPINYMGTCSSFDDKNSNNLDFDNADLTFIPNLNLNPQINPISNESSTNFIKNSYTENNQSIIDDLELPSIQPWNQRTQSLYYQEQMNSNYSSNTYFNQMNNLNRSMKPESVLKENIDENSKMNNSLLQHLLLD